MSLRRKTLVILGTTLLCLIIAILIVSQVIFLDSFVRLENENVAQNVQRALNALNDDMSAIHATNTEWAHWTDSYNFVEDLNTNYSDGNTHIGIFQTYGLNIMMYVNDENEIAFARAFDLTTEEEVPIPEGLGPYLTPDSILLNHTSADGELRVDGVEGILMLPEGALIVASSPILTNELEGPARGSLIWGRFIDEAKIAALSENVQLELDLQQVDHSSLPTDFADAESHLLTSDQPLVTPQDAQTVYGYTLLRDIFDAPALIYRVEMPRDIYAQGQTTISYFILSLVAAGVIFGIVALYLIERMVLSRVANLTESVSNIRISTDLNTRVPVSGDDELSRLGTGINGMLEALAQAHEKLEHARDQAVEALKVKAQILANVSHDARTPLNIITLRVELLKRGIYGALTDRQSELLDTVLISSRQLLFFINNLLDQASLDAGGVKLEEVTFSPKELMSELEVSMQPLAQQKGLQLSTAVENDVPIHLIGDPRRVNQVVSNLVLNAINFTDSGNVRVHVCREDAEHWALKVVDTGPGIPRDALERIFEAFWQVDGSSTRKVSTGVGLGLSIVSQLTALMGGRVSVQSELGVGSEFTILLPINHQSAGKP